MFSPRLIAKVIQNPLVCSNYYVLVINLQKTTITFLWAADVS